jgi:hypothetical protein
MHARWDGLTSEVHLVPRAVAIRHALADAAKTYRWPAMLDLLEEHPDLVNTTRLGGRSLYTPLHQAAHGGAPPDVATKLVDIGAFRTLRDANGEAPVDIARRLGHRGLVDILKPVYRRRVDLEALGVLEGRFHEVIWQRVDEPVTADTIRLPVLEPLLELPKPAMWFAVPGMYGGFSFTLRGTRTKPVLISESWCRIVDGSGQRHKITLDGVELVEEGFV